MSNPDERRRRAILMVPDQVALTIFAHALCPNENDTIRLPRMPGVPSDARVVSVHNDYRWQAFALVLESASFAPVVEGSVLPTLGDWPAMTEYVVDLARVDKQ